MSKATRLQKSGLTEELISEQPSLQVEKPEMKPWKKLTNTKNHTANYSKTTARLFWCIWRKKKKKKKSWHGRCIYVKMRGYPRLYTCARASVCLWLVCASVRVRAAPTLCPLMLCGERSIIFYDLFNLASRRELLQPSQPCAPRHNTHIKDEKQANKQTITLTNGSALPLTNRQCKTNPMRYANEEVMAARRAEAGRALWLR